MTVNHGVTGSSPVEGAKNKAPTLCVGALFFPKGNHALILYQIRISSKMNNSSMLASTAFAMLNRFKEVNAITQKTPIYVTHISHVKPLLYDALQDKMGEGKYNVTVAYDGMHV